MFSRLLWVSLFLLFLSFASAEKENKTDDVIIFNEENQALIFGTEIKNISFLFMNFSSKDEEFNNCYDKAAKDFKGKFIFTLIDTNNTKYEGLFNYFKIENFQKPNIRVIQMETMKKYELTEELSCNTFNQFLNEYLNDVLKPYYSSEKVPDNWDKGNVTILVGTNFNEVAMNPNKTVLVEFYAPWCHHCKKLAPIWEELGSLYKDNEEIVIASVDSTKNEIPDLLIDSFPTIKLFSHSTNEILNYNGERNLESLQKFLKENVPSLKEERKDEL